MLVIVDLDLGNAAAVRNMLLRLGIASELRSNPFSLSTDDRYIVPGVGNFDEGVRKMRASGWFQHLHDLPESTHILGICLGMQLLAQSSTEGSLYGLNRVGAHFERFDVAPLRVPHIGWNEVVSNNRDPMLTEASPQRFYFTHSYFAKCDNEETVTSRTFYGSNFVSSFMVGNTRGVQFHPEKSHRYGMALLSRWADLPC